MKKYTGLEVAVIGMAGRFPGALNVSKFWDNLKNGVESVRFFDDEELARAGEPASLVNDPAYVKANAFLDDKENFDSAFFNFRPAEARLLDPQMRLFHQCVWEALEDAGIRPDEANHKIGLFAGASTNINWELYARLTNGEGGVDAFTASQLSNARFVATRLAYFLNLRGPAVFMDTACSTSLVAIHQACESLLLANCNVAIAGGVSVTNKSRKGYLHAEGMIYSRDGHCRAFDAGASGTVGGEGAAAVVLKTLKNALTDGDHIWAVIKGSGINNDGNGKVGYSAPSVDGQTEAILRAQKWAKVEPRSITYVEAHGTGTTLGDPVEVEALNRAFGKSPEKYCALGSVKTNIGHLDAAAGVAGLIKTVLALKHRQIPPSLHFQSPNPAINFEDSPFFVNTTLREWQPGDYPRRAAVSAFGIGGTNAHVILEEAPEAEPTPAGSEGRLLVFSAKTPAALQRNLDNFREYLLAGDPPDLADVAYTLQLGRVAFPYRQVMVARNPGDAAEQLSALRGGSPPLPANSKTGGPIVFMFTGAGAQYVNMYRDLYDKVAFFRAEADACFAVAGKLSGRDLKAVIYPGDGPESTDRINRIENTQPALFIMEYVLARLLMRWGIRPQTVIGHSFGEYAAACISGVFSLEDALGLIFKRGEVMGKTPRGTMLSVSVTGDQLNHLLAQHPDVSLAAVNSSELYVVSGEEAAITRFRETAGAAGYKCRALRVAVAGHSHLMDGILAEFEQAVGRTTIHPQQIPLISNLTGAPASDEAIASPRYWASHLREAVRFAEGVETVLAGPQAVFIEVGPSNMLSTFVRSHRRRTAAHQVVSLVRHPDEEADDLVHLLAGIGQLWAGGITPDWKCLYENEVRRKVSLPTYSFDRKKYPVDVDARQLLAGFTPGPGGESWLPAPEADELVGEAAEASPGATEQIILRLWQQFFGKPGICRDDNFFEIGGDSLKALTMTGHLRKAFGVEIPLKEFFRCPTVRRMSEYVTTHLAEAGAAGAGESIPKAPPQAGYRLSSGQKRLYFLHAFDPAALGYNVSKIVRITGDLCLETLRSAFDKLVVRHESLRTSFAVADQEPVQQIAATAGFSLEFRQAGDADAKAVIRDFIRPFDLARCPLMRAGLVQTAPREYLLVLDMHHIIMDGISEGILIKDLLALYNQAELPEPGVSYKDYAEWQYSDSQQRVKEAQKAFWLQTFSREPGVVDLPADYPRPAVRSHEGGRVSFGMDGAATDRLKRLAEAEGATLFMVLLAVYNVLLGKLVNQEDVVVGTPVGGRNHAEVENTVGLFINTLPLRNYPSGTQTFREFLAALKANTLACFDNQRYPYEELVEELKVAREPSRNPLFDVLFIFQNFEEPALRIPGLTLEPYEAALAVAQMDLTLAVIRRGDGFLFNFEYATRLFKPETVERFAAYFRKITAAVVADPDVRLSAVDILPGEEKHQLLNAFNHTTGPYPREETVVSLFARQVERTPDQTAVVYENRRLTYRQLDEQSNRLARYLRERHQVQPGRIVGLMADRSEQMMVGLLGILKAGGAYVPVDATYPEERIACILEDCKADVLLVSHPPGESLAYAGPVVPLHLAGQAGYDGDGPAYLVTPRDLCYLIYTSGSSGTPKGVMVSHYNVVNFFAGISRQLPVGRDEALLALTSTSFDISVLELFWTLCNGIEVVIHPGDVALTALDRYLPGESQAVDFSLFFFSSYRNDAADKYRLLREAVKYADEEGFRAAWTPERHFHEFGGLYPNPSLTSAALAMITRQIELRSGSVVSPLHDPVRIAEEWSVVDNLSGGRAGISFASGWNPNDFALAPANFADRQRLLFEQIETVRKLWRGESIRRPNGLGRETDLRIFPTPVQPELPVWVTSGGNAETFRSAGAAGANLITHFLGQDISTLAENIRLYRATRVLHGHGAAGKVAVMLHTYVGDSTDAVEALVEKPFVAYLESSVGLLRLLDEEGATTPDAVSEEDKAKILRSAFLRYYKTGSLIGTKSTCSRMVQQLSAIGVDEIACLVDFGVEEEKVLEGLRRLKELKDLFSPGGGRAHKPITMMQSTPSFVQMAEESAGSQKLLASLRTLLLGGEAVPLSLVRELGGKYPAALYNMYGPTETTIWSCMHPLDPTSGKVSIGKPLLNQQVYILDRYLQLLPRGVAGDLYIGGEGVARGYWNRPELTAEKFIPSPFREGERLYMTGDVARWLPDGTLQLVGRQDHQVKIRGYRIELGEIENTLLSYPGVKEAVVVAKAEEATGSKYLVAYVVAGEAVPPAGLRSHLGRVLPDYMVPAFFVQLAQLPLTPNGKVDRKALPGPSVGRQDDFRAPSNAVEREMAVLWAEVLQLDKDEISVSRSFFELGGHSLKAAVLVNKISKHFGVEVPLKEVFNKQSIERQADYLITLKQIETEIIDDGEIIEMNI